LDGVESTVTGHLKESAHGKCRDVPCPFCVSNFQKWENFKIEGNLRLIFLENYKNSISFPLHHLIFFKKYFSWQQNRD